MFREISLKSGLVKNSVFEIKTTAELFITALRRLTKERKPSFFSHLSLSDEKIYLGMLSESNFLLERKSEVIDNAVEALTQPGFNLFKIIKTPSQLIKIKGVIDKSSDGINISIDFIPKSLSVFYTHLILAVLALLTFILFRQKSDMISGGCLIWLIGEVINLPVLFFSTKNSLEKTEAEFEELVMSQFEYTQY